MSVLFVVIVAVVAALWFGIQLINNRGRSATNGPTGRSLNGRLRAREQAEIRDGMASRQLLAETFGAPDATPRRPLGLVFAEASDEGMGLRVDSVTAGSPCARIGVPAGARLVSINSAPVRREHDIDAAVRRQPPGLPTHLVWESDGRENSGSVIV